jgi:hypothetical protein
VKAMIAGQIALQPSLQTARIVAGVSGVQPLYPPIRFVDPVETK